MTLLGGPTVLRERRQGAALPAMISLALLSSLFASVPAKAVTPPVQAPVRAPAVTCPEEMPTEIAARLAARVCGRRVRAAAMTTENDEYFVNPDGTLTLEHRYRPVRVRRDGGWVPADATLVTAADGTVVPKAASVSYGFSGGGDGPLVRAAREGVEFTLGSPLGTLPKPVVSGATATYPEVLPGVDLVLTADVDGFAQKLMVKNRRAAADPRLRSLTFGADVDKGALKADRHGNLTVVDEKDEPVFAAVANEMWDAAAENAARKTPAVASKTVAEALDPGRRATMGVKVGRDAITITPDAALLADPATVFPVTIDPSFTAAKSAWTYVDSRYPTSTYWNSSNDATSGTSDSGGMKRRSFFNMNLSGMGTRKQIVSATFNLYEHWAWSCSARNVELHRTAAVSSSTNWNNQPASNLSIGAKNVAHGWSSSGQGGPSSCPAAWVGWNVASALQGVMDAGGTSVTFMVKASSETDNTYWKRFANNPNISITYNTLPGTPTALAMAPCSTCSSPALVGAAQPNMSAKVSDADGTAQRADFEVWNSTKATKITGGSVSGVANNGTGTWRVATPLANTSYNWRVRTYDGTAYGAWSAWFAFTVDAAAPDAPEVSSSDYPAGTWSKGAGQAGTFTVTPAGADVSAVLWSFDGGAQQSAANTGSAHTVTWTPATDGPHTLRAWVKDKAGNLSEPAQYDFGVGRFAVTSPQDASSTARRTVLAAAGSAGVTAVSFSYRRGEADDWHQVPAADVRRRSDGAAVTWPVAMTAGVSPDLVWDVTRTLTEDGAIEIRAEFTTSGGTAASAKVDLTVDRDAEGATTGPIGPGTVNLLNGDFRMTTTDASMFGVGLMRSFSSRDPRKGSSLPGVAPIFGAEWTPNGLAQSGDGTFTELHATSATSVEITGDGASVGFTKNTDGSWTPQSDAGNLRLTYDAAADRYTLTDSTTADRTVFAKVNDAYLVRAVYPAGGKGGTVFVWEPVTGADGARLARPTRIIAPAWSVASPSDCDVATLAALPEGCRLIVVTYATTTTAGAQLGDVAGQVKQISLWEGGVAAPRGLSEYRYDDLGRLRERWDPATPAVKTRYDYDLGGRVNRFTPPGELPWTLTYGRAGNADTAADGMLLAVSRPTLRPGTLSETNGTAVTSVVYDVPTSGGGAPYNLSPAATLTWGQTDPPSDATAIFPPDQVPANHTGRGGLAASDYGRATVTYLNANGATVNRAEPGGGLSASQYDAHGNTVSNLSAGNRALAFGQGPGAAEELTRLGLINSSTAERARLLSEETVYSADGQRMLGEFGPLHLVRLNGVPTPARKHQVNTLDEGRPADAKVSGLVTTTAVGAWSPGGGADADVRLTRTFYDWATGKVVRTVTDPGGLAVTRTTGYDADGRVVSATMPKSSGDDAGTTTSAYYTADGSGACGGRPEWAGLLCRTQAKQNVSGGGSNPSELVTKVYAYEEGGRVASVTETANGVTRTTATTYDTAGQVLTTTVTGGLGTAVPAVTNSYDAAGRLTRTTASTGASITREYDALGRQTSYTDADGGVTRVEYDALDRVIRKTDGAPSTMTYEYDLDADPRGLLTAMTDSVAGRFTATYDAEGGIVAEQLPGGVSYTVGKDPTGAPTRRVYQNAAGVKLLDDAVTWSIHGQQLTRTGLSAQVVGYDKIGRISSVDDTVGGVCTRRAYGYDANSNRTSLTSGGCDGGDATTRTHAYDTGDRLVDQGYVYDAFGRTVSTPDGLAVDYYATDLVKAMTSGDARQSYTLDPQLRRNSTLTEARTGGTWAATARRVEHFDADDDTPAWVVEDVATGRVSRNVHSVSGGLAAVTSATGEIRLQLTNLHDDINVVLDLTTGVPLALDFDEFGNPRPGQPAGRYGWHGAAERVTDTPDGTILMGVRLYQPKLGRFLQTDPVEGGSANAYDYAAQAPTSNADLDGRKWYWCRTFSHFAFNHCGVTRAWYHGSWRTVRWVKTPRGWWVRGILYDYCTSSPDRPLGFDFRQACMMHDYGYALRRMGYISSKYQADAVFYNVLWNGVCPAYAWWKRGTCRNLATTYYLAVFYGGRV
ncbi:DNRLRE domain-containing protein [Herbidospora sp. NEAU-GS84]|uniref:DNRLRE domain-containing protein n=1 Tax=Herbidospora solisilvae TaxID=2696284 RepID=A0A7C9J9P4_9ACTN|nr:phospholipase A2 [Herbidospora solisilvae]NAS20604.1 DNRLRE domain-containing protein [Herbidospora solisilvae]